MEFNSGFKGLTGVWISERIFLSPALFSSHGV